MGGMGSGGVREGAGRKTIDGEPRTKISHMVVKPHMRRGRPPQTFCIPTHYRIFNERA